MSEVEVEGCKWPHTHWIEKLMYLDPINVEISNYLQKMVSSWKEILAKAEWIGNVRLDSSLEQILCLCKPAMLDGKPLFYLTKRQNILEAFGTRTIKVVYPLREVECSNNRNVGW